MSHKHYGGGSQGSMRCLMGIDVGTRSARPGLFDTDGRLLSGGRHDTAAFSYAADCREHSCHDIWRGVRSIDMTHCLSTIMVD